MPCWRWPARLGEVPRAWRCAPSRAARGRLAGRGQQARVQHPEEGRGALPTAIDALLEPAEQALAAALAEVAPQADARFEAHDYTGSLQALAALKAPVDAFFEDVMVNAEDPALRANRLALLNGCTGDEPRGRPVPPGELSPCRSPRPSS
jgi:glycyl-tRNA synthetase beta chain